MNCWTLGDLKKAISECPEMGDDTPLYISVERKVEEGVTEGELHALEVFGCTGKGGIITIGGFEGGMDPEDEENLL